MKTKLTTAVCAGVAAVIMADPALARMSPDGQVQSGRFQNGIAHQDTAAMGIDAAGPIVTVPSTSEAPSGGVGVVSVRRPGDTLVTTR